MEGRATAPAAGTILNALATHTGAAFAIDAYTSASVTLDETGAVTGAVTEDGGADTRLIERCVERVVAEFGDGEGGHVVTESEVPMAGGLKSSSAAANATVLATLDALDAVEEVSRIDAARIGVAAARDAGVTVTGAFDDASASMLGGVTVTDNDADELLHRDDVDWHVAVYTPDERAYSADADVARCERIAPVAGVVADLALTGEYGTAMTINGFAYCGALGFSADPIVDALSVAEGASLSGTGPSYVAIGTETAVRTVRDEWRKRDGDTWITTTQNDGARTT